MHSGFALQKTSVELCCILTAAWFTGSANANGLKKASSTRCYCKEVLNCNSHKSGRADKHIPQYNKDSQDLPATSGTEASSTRCSEVLLCFIWKVLKIYFAYHLLAPTLWQSVGSSNDLNERWRGIPQIWNVNFPKISRKMPRKEGISLNHGPICSWLQD